MPEHELLVIGGGTSGLRAAVIAAKNDVDVAIVEPGAIGGTCLNTGCIPTKTLLHSAEVYREAKDSGELGLHAEVEFDFGRIMSRMHEIVNTGRAGAEESVHKLGIELYKGKAKFTGKNTVQVNDQEIKAKKIIIATGCYPWAPPINGLKETGYINNEGALELHHLPESMIMIGGGYISCEFASFFASLGCKVTILERLPKILSMLDDDVSSFMQEQLEKLGIEIHTNTDLLEISGKNMEEVHVKTKIVDQDSGEKTYSAKCLFVSTGRRPNTEGMELEKAKIKTERGSIVVDEYLRSSNKKIYAIGDVNGKAPFAHAAKREAKVVLENALLKKKRKVRHDLVPWAVFTFPTIGGVGLSEKQAREKYKKVGVMKAEFGRTGKAKILRKTDGFVKVIYDQKTRNLLGCVITGPDAHNLIHEFALLLNTPDPKIDYLLETIHVHPTLAEVMSELKN